MLYYSFICGTILFSDSWEIQSSLVSSPKCPPDYLPHIAEGIGKELGYGYILRIISRNPQVKQKTLKTKANGPTVGPRYSQCAISALENGKESANHQI